MSAITIDPNAGGWISLGLIQIVSGTPQRATNNLPDPTRGVMCHGIFFQQVRNNGGYIFIGRSNLNVNTGVDFTATLPVPTLNSLPNAVLGIPPAANGINAGDYWIDGTNSGDFCLVSMLVL